MFLVYLLERVNQATGFDRKFTLALPGKFLAADRYGKSPGTECRFRGWRNKSVF